MVRRWGADRRRVLPDAAGSHSSCCRGGPACCWILSLVRARGSCFPTLRVDPLLGRAPGFGSVQCRGRVHLRAPRLRASRNNEKRQFLAWSIFQVQREMVLAAKAPMSIEPHADDHVSGSTKRGMRASICLARMGEDRGTGWQTTMTAIDDKSEQLPATSKEAQPQVPPGRSIPFRIAHPGHRNWVLWHPSMHCCGVA
jgi:hypothetical protein